MRRSLLLFALAATATVAFAAEPARYGARLAAGPSVAANPADLSRLGVSDGGRVKLTSPRGSLTVTVTATTAVPAGTIAMALAQGEPSPTTLIDATAPVTDVRVETVS